MNLRELIAEGLGTNIRIGDDVADLIIDFTYKKCEFCYKPFPDEELYNSYLRGTPLFQFSVCMPCIRKNQLNKCYWCYYYSDNNIKYGDNRLAELCGNCVELRDNCYYHNFYDICLSLKEKAD